jgi:ABC-type transporter Mla subunit MlaD
VLINSGGFTQIGDIVHNFNASLSGRASDVRDLIQRLDRFVGMLDEQRDNIVASIGAVNRFAGKLAGQREIITQALSTIPPALDVLISERPRIVTALDKLRVFSDTTTRLVNDAGSDLVKNLQNLEPTIAALADIGPELDRALAYAPTFPFTQNFIDRAIRGDYVNGFFTMDLTNARLRKSLLLGTHWGRLGAEQVPAPGDPGYLQYQYAEGGPGVPAPVGAPLTPVPGQGVPLPPTAPAQEPPADQGFPVPGAAPIPGPADGGS